MSEGGRVQQVCWQFGITPQIQTTRPVADYGLVVRPGQITLVTGPSGAGKSSVLRALGDRLGRRAVCVDRQRLDGGRPVVEQVAVRRPLAEAISILTACGLGEPRLWLRRPGELSDGERFRAQLARAVGVAQATTAAQGRNCGTAVPSCGRSSNVVVAATDYWQLTTDHYSGGTAALGCDSAPGWAGPVLLVDEFCAILHRRLACAMAYTLRKLVTAGGLCLVAATTHEDLLADLQPDQVLRLGGERPEVIYRRECERKQPQQLHRRGAEDAEKAGGMTTRTATTTHRPQADRLNGTATAAADGRGTRCSCKSRRPISFFRRLHIAAGHLRDYRTFEAMHYRRRSGLGPCDKIFVLRDGVGGEALGVVVYGYSPLSLHLRNVAVGAVVPRNGQLLNRDFRILRRLVIHPDVRGCGLAHWLVRQTLPRVGTKYVECLAAMGAVNPVFEYSGMVRLGTAGLPGRQEKLRAALAALGVDPLAADFARMVTERQDVRALVGRHVQRWVEATTARPIARTRAMRPADLASAFVQFMGTAPIYYLWSKDEQENNRLRNVATRLGQCSKFEPRAY